MAKGKPHEDPKCFCSACGEWHVGTMAEQARSYLLDLERGLASGLVTLDAECDASYDHESKVVTVKMRGPMVRVLGEYETGTVIALLSDLQWEKAKSAIGGALLVVGVEVVAWGVRALLGH